MSDITDDILALEQKQKDYKALKGKYLQCLRTPETIPTIGDSVSISKLTKPDYALDEMGFSPKSKDYSFQVDIWETVGADGYYIRAKRNLGNGIIEIVTKAYGSDISFVDGSEIVE